MGLHQILFLEMTLVLSRLLSGIQLRDNHVRHIQQEIHICALYPLKTKQLLLIPEYLIPDGKAYMMYKRSSSQVHLSCE